MTGVICLSDATTGQPLMLLDARSVTALRTGAVAAVATRALAPERRADGRDHRLRPARRLDRAVHGRRRATGRACASIPTPTPRPRSAAELGWRVGSREQALGCDVVCCVTPGHAIVVEAGDLRPGLHLNMLGADGPGKAEATVGAVASCALFCDEWAQASHGGELTGAIEAGLR